MEVWTFIHKETNEIIRADIRAGDFDFGQCYYFTTSIYAPIWFVSSEEEAKVAYCKYVHPQYSMNYKRPATDRIKLEDYTMENSY